MAWQDDYEPVEDRLREFWSKHPEGRVVTELDTEARDPDDVIIFRADVYRDEVCPVSATGYAHQRLLKEPPQRKDGKGFNTSAPEWTSPWEVAETSAIGRALANLGYAAKGKRPSREEVSKAEASGGGGGGLAVPASPPSDDRPVSHTTGPAGAPTTEPEGFGEGPTATGGGAPAHSFETLVKLIGSRSTAREFLNATVGKQYSASSALTATEEEIVITEAAWAEQQPVAP